MVSFNFKWVWFHGVGGLSPQAESWLSLPGGDQCCNVWWNDQHL